VRVDLGPRSYDSVIGGNGPDGLGPFTR